MVSINPQTKVFPVLDLDVPEEIAKPIIAEIVREFGDTLNERQIYAHVDQNDLLMEIVKRYNSRQNRFFVSTDGIESKGDGCGFRMQVLPRH